MTTEQRLRLSEIVTELSATNETLLEIGQEMVDSHEAYVIIKIAEKQIEITTSLLNIIK